MFQAILVQSAVFGAHDRKSPETLLARREVRAMRGKTTSEGNFSASFISLSLEKTQYGWS
jgi:hypothetical protein